MTGPSAVPLFPWTNDPVFVICAADAVTGGPELLHQLVDLLRSAGRDARIIYVPFGDNHAVPEPYRGYDVRIGTLAEITPSSLVVLPEAHPWKLRRLPRCHVYLWWLSVDNFCLYASANRAGRFLPRALLQHAALMLVRARAAAHLFQSEYARLFGEAHNLRPLLPLSDRLSEPYVAAARTRRNLNREDVVAYNPAKGAERTRLILKAVAKMSPDIRVIAVEKMSRDDVVNTLGGAKLYIDFGDHPGKDRLPREAAALGCCVLVNRRGSAANDHDIPIPAAYKVDDTRANFETSAARMIVDICARFSDHAANFDSYRAGIASEPTVFAAEIDRVFGTQLTAANAGNATDVSGH